jgi:NADPH-dependent 2,4-dienoyl-CoA reductase/sulfur reductase-like enzyme
MAKERLVVIGGNAAGMTAAAQARRRRPDLEIVVFERGQYVSYAA